MRQSPAVRLTDPSELTDLSAPPAAALSPIEDSSLAGDYDDDTATFKSALSSSEAIRRRGQYREGIASLPRTGRC